MYIRPCYFYTYLVLKQHFQTCDENILLTEHLFRDTGVIVISSELPLSRISTKNFRSFKDHALIMYFLKLQSNHSTLSVLKAVRINVILSLYTKWEFWKFS